LEDPKIWSDNAKSQALGKEKRELGLVVEALIHLQSGLQDAQDLFDMAREEDDDATLLSVASDAQALEKQIAEMEFRRMFSGPMDACKEAGIQYIELPVAFDALTVVVNPKNDFVKSLSVAELNAIWKSGSSVKNWKQVNPAYPDKA